MNKILTLSSGGATSPIKRQKTVGREIVIGETAIKFVAVAICTLLAIVYLTQSTAGANRGVKIGNLETKQGQLLLEKERMEVEQTRLRSLKEIDNSIDKSILGPGSAVQYLKN